MVVGGGGGLESKLSDQLWLSFSLALAKPNNFTVNTQLPKPTKLDLISDHFSPRCK